MKFTDNETAILKSEQKAYKSADSESRTMIVRLVVRRIIFIDGDSTKEISKEEKDDMNDVSIHSVHSIMMLTIILEGD
jgi:hypothetical protein